MTRVFSFTLFGNEAKYCKGLLKNIAIIEKDFPSWEIWVYCGDGIPEQVMLDISQYKNAKLIPTGQTGMVNKFYRFFAIDDPSVEICIVRDADSRIYTRDQACIQQFLQSDKLVHIIRDHPNHHHAMMAGMWGAKGEIRSYCPLSISLLFSLWSKSKVSSDFWSDTQFLCEVLYPHVLKVALIHDETQQFEVPMLKQPFPTSLNDKHFIGQVYEFDSEGNEFPKFSYNE
jgi:hypothetical protein